ncbi:uncharacterized protein PAC_14375 [Phialocephala subalpina]|uniref:Transcription factor domain-containing protein n=1 Tax=Phialocephala subalpina TaxID=576137 RepID=A0A1L7XHP9_9HELO|nr:uncharacterized protein PAC_14375 [Phialocephala subalpina]
MPNVCFGMTLSVWRFLADKDQASFAISCGDSNAAQTLDQDYHLGTLLDSNDLQSIENTAYLGPGSSARLLEQILKSAVNWHSTNNAQLPKKLVPDDPSRLIQQQNLHRPKLFFITYEQRRSELHYLVPRSTQRAIIEHHLKVVSPEYNIFSAEQEWSFLSYENPLKWSSSNTEDPGAFALTVVFAVSTALASRDLDTNLSVVAIRCREEVQKLSQRASSFEDQVEAMRWTCTALCALSLCELINPTGQLWELLGRAASTLEQFLDYLRLRNSSPGSDFQRLELLLLKLESSAALHFGRPSRLCAVRLGTIVEDSSAPPSMSDDLNILIHLYKISQAFQGCPNPSKEFLESLIPPTLQVSSQYSDTSMSLAILYIALHPLFTDSDLWCGGTLDEPSSKLFGIIANSASTFIDRYAQLNGSSKIISLWMAAEKLLEAGGIWAAYVIHGRRTALPGERFFADMAMSVAMGPTMKVSSLLASFAARWKSGSAYVDAWECLIELLWNML